MTDKGVVFMSLESPWPGYAGGTLRAQGLLKEIAKGFPVKLVVLSSDPLREEQRLACLAHVGELVEIPRQSIHDAIPALGLFAESIRRRLPIHTIIVDRAVRNQAFRRYLQSTNEVVFCSMSHWGSLALDGMQSERWILDQQNADVHFWEVYARESRNPLKKLAARLNWWLARGHFETVYGRVGRVVSVCQEDREHTLAVCPSAAVEVIENGVDCSLFTPNRRHDIQPPRMLFTGTSAERNMQALRYFMGYILPQVRECIPEAEFVVGGSFSQAAQDELSRLGRVSFTGQVPDLRPSYDAASVFINPFRDSYGSKLKIAQALAMGMCIVSTEAGCRGFPVVDGVSALIASDDRQFAYKTILALSDQDVSSRIGYAARELAIQKLDWAVLGERLRAMIKLIQDSSERR